MSTPTKEVELNESGKGKGSFFVSVRERGILNSILDEPAKMYERMHPDKRVRWEYFPSNGDTTMVVAREALGWEIVDSSELAEHMPASWAKSGPMRRGDLVMMAADVAIAEEEDAADARAAAEDLKLSERAYRDNLETTKTRRRDGEIDWAKPTGTVKRQVETVQVNIPDRTED